MPAGSYTIFTVPNADKWTLIVNKKTGEWGIPYKYESDELARVDMKVSKPPSPAEEFKISYEKSGSGCADADRLGKQLALLSTSRRNNFNRGLAAGSRLNRGLPAKYRLSCRCRFVQPRNPRRVRGIQHGLRVFFHFLRDRFHRFDEQVHLFF